MPPFQVNDTILLTPEEKANALADTFLKNHQNPLANENMSHTIRVNNRVNRYIRNCEVTRGRNDIVTTTETTKIIKGLKSSKSPGIDKIHNKLIKKLPEKAILTFIIIACLALSYLPQEWKSAKVIAIKKPNKSASDPFSYRPISLLSSLSKILERAVLIRLNKHLHANSIIPEAQHGFRQQKSTTTMLHRVTNHIKSQLRNKKSTGMVLLDIEKAFD